MTNGNAKGKFEDSRATGIDVASDALASMRLKLLASTYVNSALRNSSSQIASAFKDNDNQIKEAASKNPGRKLEIYHKDAAPSEEWMTRALIAGTALTGISYITIDHNSKENELVVGLICVAVCFIFLTILAFRKITVVRTIEATGSHRISGTQKTRGVYPTTMKSQAYVLREYFDRNSNLPHSLKSGRVGWHELIRRNRTSGYSSG
ncbi:hypothetical protein [Methylobacterium radiotolerans]|uniref:hypothetical protein n=1 Tax=Methylobacterium radiotolerans TaxID=31998 RepID=UPI001195A549|nr:hypothetical protein [Methylobacterium radiotolerans]GEN01792.1 hypothetical protein MRA01_63310 [Methylobacterium radiotolerans]